jgi:predicted secreted protein
MKSFLFLFMGLWLTVSGCTAQNTTQKVEGDGKPALDALVSGKTRWQANQKATLKVGQQAYLQISENATTGYLWSVENTNPELLRAQEPRLFNLSGADNAEPRMVGVGREKVYIWQGQKPGTGTLTFHNMRGDDKAGAAETFQIAYEVVK